MIYLASPYSSPLAETRHNRYESTKRATINLIQSGLDVFSPIVYGHPLVIEGGLKGDWETWQAMDRDMIQASTSIAVLMLPGWDSSVGVSAEILFAMDLGRPVYYLDPEICLPGARVGEMRDCRFDSINGRYVLESRSS